MSIRPSSPPINPLSLIDRILAEIELTETQHAQAKQSYGAIAAVLQKAGSPLRLFNPFNRSQGSMRIGTTVRPLAREEHDLDVLCCLEASGAIYSPHHIYKMVWDTLYSDGTYREMIEPKRCCIRIRYAREFHLDVTPAIPDWLHKTESLFVPDKERKIWCTTHPIGFADEFFKPISAKAPPVLRQITSANSRSFSAAVEPLPEYGAFEKSPLQRTVQLVKYDRDRRYADDVQHRPSSILLTTLAAQAYQCELSRSADTLIEFIVRVVERIPRGVTIEAGNGKRIYSVRNPLNVEENFAESWSDQHYIRFMKWHASLVAWIRSTASLEACGGDILLNQIGEEFGKEQVVKAAKAIGKETQESLTAGKLKLGLSSRIGGLGAAVPQTVFFGA